MATVETRYARWVKDYLAELRTGQPTVMGAGGRKPAYGDVVDKAVLERANDRMAGGLKVDSIELRRLLVVELQRTNQSGLLVENDGDYLFGESWSQRFFARHNLVVRVANTKMRDSTFDFEEKLRLFQDILSLAIADNDVPSYLVVNLDETSAQFVNTDATTRAVKGQKKINKYIHSQTTNCLRYHEISDPSGRYRQGQSADHRDIMCD